MRALCAFAAWAAMATEARSAQDERRYEFEIREKTLGDALDAIVKKTKLIVLYPYELAGRTGVNPVIGQYTVREAIDALFYGTVFSGGLTENGVMYISVSGYAQQGDREMEVAGEKLKRSILTSAATLLFGGGAAAQDAATDQNNDVADAIVVTAQKRSERIQDVPISISVLDGERLDRSTSLGLVDELNRIAGVVADEAGQGGGANISIRGVTAAGPNFFGSSTVTYYLDATPFGSVRSARGPDTNVYDLQRVEVLRGPQGTLYGASALSGVVRVLTKDVNLDEFELKARTAISYTQGGEDNYRGDLVVNMPLVEGKLGARAAIGYQGLGGWIDNPFAENVNDTQIRNMRLKIGAAPIENLSLDASVWTYRSTQGAPPFSDSLDGASSSLALQMPLTTHYTLSSFKAAYELPLVSLTSTTGYLDYSNDGRLSLEYVLPDVNLQSIFDSTVLTQEILLNSAHGGPLRWSLGAFYRDARDRTYQLRNIDGVPASNYAQAAIWRDRSESIALFGEATGSFFDGLIELTAGLRYFNDEVTLIEDQRLTGAPPLGVPVVDKFEKVTKRFVLKWRPERDITVYASYSEGFRSGTHQLPVVLAQEPSLPPAEPDNLINYEIGGKATLWDGKASLDAAVYYIDWQDTQQSISIPVAPPVFIAALVNSESASGMGLEVALGLKPADGLDLSVTFGWNDLTFDSDVLTTTAAGTNILLPKGGRLANSPEYTAGATAGYRFPVGAHGLEGRLSASANYVSQRIAYTLNPGGPPTIDKGESRVVGHASVGVGSADDRWNASVFVENIANDTTSIAINQQSPFAVRPRPRTVGLQLEYSY